MQGVRIRRKKHRQTRPTQRRRRDGCNIPEPWFAFSYTTYDTRHGFSKTTRQYFRFCLVIQDKSGSRVEERT